MQENPLAVSRLFPLDVDDHSLSQFSHVNHLANEIARQNQDFRDSVPQIDDQIIQSEVMSGLVQLQKDTFEDLVVKGAALPYERILEKEKELDIKLGRVAIADEERSRFIEGIDKDVKIAKQVLPRREDDLILLGEERKQTFRPSSEALEAEAMLKAELSQEKLLLQSLWDEVAQPWPIPQLLTREDLNNASQIVIDFFPEQYTPPDSKEVVERTRRRYKGRLEDASEFLALILSEEVSAAYSQEDLGQALYGDDENGAHKISSLISNFRTGMTTIIGDVLSREGLVLQEGIRRYFDPLSQDELRKATRIYRAIPEDKVDEKARIIRCADGSHYLETLWKNINSSDGGIETHEKPIEERIVNKSQEKNTGVSGDSPKDSEQTDARSPNKSQEQQGKQTLKEVTRKLIAPEWIREFREDVRGTIEELSEEGLIRREQISIRDVNRFSRSPIVGTKESMDRSLKAGLISRKDVESGMFTSTQITAMKMLNTHRKFLSKAISRKKQKTALKCIREEINKSLQEQDNDKESK